VNRNSTKTVHRLFIRRLVTIQIAAALSFLALLGMSVHSLASDQGSVSPLAGPVATKATCGKHDRPESGVQGFSPLQDRFASGVPRAFNCNLDLIGQARGKEAQGAGLGLAVTDTCLYYSQGVPPNIPLPLDHPGTVVVDASDPTHPKIVNHLDVQGAIVAAQTVDISLKRHLLITSSDFDEKHGELVYNNSLQTIDIFDISDCLHPLVKFSGVIPHFALHTGEFSADGNTFWAASGPSTSIGAVSALDVSDPSHPKLIAQWHPADPTIRYIHGVTVSDDGNTAYANVGSINKGLYSSKSWGAESWKDLDHEPPQGVALLNVSQVQARKPNAEITEISHLYWNDVQIPQFVYPMTIKGHRYLWFVDLMGALSTFDAITLPGRTLGPGPLSVKGFASPDADSAVACRTYPTRPGWGYISIIDIDNPAKPVRVSDLRLAVDEPKNCASEAPQPRLRGYMGMFCDLDNYQDGRMMACGFGESGIRVFDVRDVRHPREIAYYKPPAAGSAVRKGADYEAYLDESRTLQGTYHSADLVGNVFFAKGDTELWFTSNDGGAQFLRFSKDLMDRERGLFVRDNTCHGKLRSAHGC
jgi:hypothetical protein